MADPGSKKIAKKIGEQRGRPRIPLFSDPDKYAIAALLPIDFLFRIGKRKSAYVAAQMFASTTSPETIRSKARYYYDRIPDDCGSMNYVNNNLNCNNEYIKLDILIHAIFMSVMYVKGVDSAEYDKELINIGKFLDEEKFVNETLMPILQKGIFSLIATTYMPPPEKVLK